MAQSLQLVLEKHGCGSTLIDSFQSQSLPDFVAQHSLIMVAGGDGTLLHMLPLLIESQTPVYMLPTGNESLFAKQFSMSASEEEVVEVITSGTLTRHYVPSVNERPFFTMMSLGPDSRVVERIAEIRQGPISHWSYMFYSLKELIDHQVPQVSLVVDGKQELQSEAGFLVIANSRQYAWGVEFVREARSMKKELCARFFPYEDALNGLSWFLRGLLYRETLWEGLPFYRGQEFHIDVPAYPIQADGECLGDTPAVVAMKDQSILVLSRPLPPQDVDSSEDTLSGHCQ